MDIEYDVQLPPLENRSNRFKWLTDALSECPQKHRSFRFEARGQISSAELSSVLSQYTLKWNDKFEFCNAEGWWYVWYTGKTPTPYIPEPERLEAPANG